MDCAFDAASKKSSNPRSSGFSPMLSSRNLIVLCFTFKSVIYFELSFVKGVRSASTFIFLACGCQLFQHHLLKRLFSLHCIAFAPLSKIR